MDIRTGMAGLLLWQLSPALFAQDSALFDPSLTERQAVRQAQSNSGKLPVASLLSPAAPESRPAHAVQLTAGQDAGSANIKLQLGNAAGHASTSLIGSVPLKKDSDRTDAWSPDGTVNGTRIELRHQRGWFTGTRRGNKNLAADVENCARLLDRLVPKERRGGTGCDPGLLKEYADQATYDEARGLFLAPDAAAVSLAGGVSFNYDDFTWYDPTRLDKHKERHRGVGLNFQAAYQPLDKQVLYAASIAIERGLESADSKIACLAGAGPVLSCVEGATAPPAKVWSRVLTLEYRAYLGSRTAISVQLARDFASGTNSLQIPVYLVANDKDALTGGVAVGYFNDERKTQFAVFVTKAFSLWD